MIITMMKPVSIDIKPGDKVEIQFRYRCKRQLRDVIVRRLVETDHGTYAVLSNHTWRPLSSYGRTWKKVEDA